MEKEDLRVSTNYEELSKIIQRISLTNQGFTIWQSINDIKNVIPGAIKSHFHYENDFTIDFTIRNPGNIDHKSEVFMYSPALNILIKGKVKILSKIKLKVVINKKFYVKENRKKPRINLDDKDIKGEILRKVDLKDSLKAEEVKLKDISDQGFGFYVTPSRAIFFQPDSKLVFNSLEKIGFNREISGKVTHITPVSAENGLTNKLMLVGVKFDAKITDINEILQTLHMNKALA